MRELYAFQRVKLEPGQKKVIPMEVPRDALAYLDEDMRPVVDPGAFHIFVGGDSTAIVAAHFEVR